MGSEPRRHDQVCCCQSANTVNFPSAALFRPDAKVLERHGLDRTASPQAKLAFTLTATLAEGALMEWSATWPTMEDFEASMPMFWPEHVLVHLPASVSAPLARQRADYARDWTAVRKAVIVVGVGEREFGPYHASVIQELTFAYGAHSSDKLLVHYGFVPESTTHHASPDDEIRLDHVILPQLSEDVKSQLQDLGYLGSYALLPAENSCSGSPNCSRCGAQVWEPCFKTQVAVRAAVLSCNEWEYFATNGEDLVEDQSDAVFAWLRPFLDEYRLESEREVSAIDRLCVTDKENAAAWASLHTRWRQIRDALATFLEAIDT
nr:hypothetical protein B0A51_00372 [Rachicladosporium sp. CCFEE 5018]